MKFSRWACVVLLLVTAGQVLAAEPEGVRAYQSSQQRVRQMARDLVTEVLDVQLEQFRFNGLTENPAYRDIVAMRRNVDALIQGEMREVVALLDKAQQAPAGERDKIISDARARVREIVKTLSAERQRVLQRIRVAKVSGQTERLLGLQRNALTLTKALPGIADMEIRETQTVSAIQDQRDIHTLFLELAGELGQMSGWGPPAGPAAADGLRMLKAHKVPDSLIAADKSLESVQYDKAAAAQEAVVQGLSALLYEVGGGAGGARAKAGASAKAEKSADVLAGEVEALLRLDVALARIRGEHDQAEPQIPGAPQAAVAIEKKVAEDLAAEQGRAATMPDNVVTRLTQARTSALDAVQAIPTGTAAARSAVRVTGDSLDHAQAAVRLALADARRQALGVKIGELARAIDALERASVAERAQSVRALQAADKGGFDKPAAKRFADEQQTVADVTRNVSEAVKNTAPGALKALADALAAAESAKARVGAEGAGAEAAKHAGEDTAKASDLLADATKTIRGEIQLTADRLDEEASKELAMVSKVSDEVERVLKEMQASAAHRLAQLDAAEERVLSARADQLRAAGQPETAASADLVSRLQRAETQQAAASDTVGRFSRSEADGPLDAVNELQKLADMIEELTKLAAGRPQAPEAQRGPQGDALAKAAREAHQAAEAAVQAMLAGNTRGADTASKAAQAAIQKAAAQAQAELATAKQGTPQAPDAAAQQRVTNAAQQAAQLTNDHAPPATEQLRKASDESEQAGKQIAEAKSDARKTQESVADRLKQAHQEIEAARKKLAEQARKELDQQGAKAAQLAAAARKVDPTAGGALKRAGEAAQKDAGGPPSASAKHAPKAAASAQKNVEQAAAKLESRKQDLEQDRKIAEKFKQLAEQQQKARNELVALGPALSELLAQRNPLSEAAGPKQPKAPDAQPGKAAAKGATPPNSQGQGQMSPPSPPSPQLQKGAGPSPPGPPGESGMAPPGQQQAQPEQPPLPFSDKEKLDKAKQLTSALGDYMGSQDDMGDLAEKLSEQKKVANQALKNALKEAAKLNPNLERAKSPMFIPPAEQPVFPPSNKPRLPEQIAGSGAMPQQKKQDPKDAEGAIAIPPQTQGPKNPASTSGQAKDTNNPQVENPPEDGVNASTIVQTAPITSAPQPGAPPGAPGVFQPNEGNPSPATPSSQSTPPKAGKQQGQKLSKEQAEKAIAELEKAQKQKKKRKVPKAAEQTAQKPPKPPAPLGEEFKPEAPEETAEQLAGKETVEEAKKEIEKNDPAKKEDQAAKDEGEDEVEEVAAAPKGGQESAPKDKKGKTGTTPGDLGMGQGTPGKGVGGESTGGPTEDRPQKGNQHGRFDGKRPWAKGGPEDLIPKGHPLPPGFKPEFKFEEEKDPFAIPTEEAGEKPTPPDVDGNIPVGWGGGRSGKGPAPGTRTADTKVSAKKFQDDPWFAKLPPELRAAMQSTSKPQAPRGYEEKLRRYRESTD